MVVDFGFGVAGFDGGWPPGEGEVEGPWVAEGFGFGVSEGLLAGFVGVAAPGVDGALLGGVVGVPGAGVGVGVSMQATPDGAVGEVLLPLHKQVTPTIFGQSQFPELVVAAPLPALLPPVAASARGMHPAPPVGVGSRASQMVT